MRNSEMYRYAIVGILMAISFGCAEEEQPANRQKSGEPVDSMPELRWEEPLWDEAATEQVTLRLRFTPGETRVLEAKSSFRASIGSETEEGQAFFRHDVRTERITEDGRAVVITRETARQLTSAASPGAGFIPTWARRTVSPLGVVTDPNGATDLWSFPVLPKEPVRVGSSWKRPIKWRIAHNTPNALASGVCEYRLAALGSYQGKQVAKIEFSISAKMPKRDLVLQQVIGVKSVKPVPEKGTHIGEVVPGFPAQRAGILPGDVVIQVGDMPTYSFSDLVFAVAASTAGEPVRMLLVRKGEKVELSVTPLAVKSGSLAIDAQVGGILVFDVDRGTVLRTETRRCVVNMLGAIDGKEFHQRIQGSFVIQTREGMKAEQ